MRLPLPPDPRQLVRGGIAALFSGDRFPEERYDVPPGDPGLFGPGSVTWRVHADVTMFVGGISALMLQALHPLAAAGVAGSSRFREEPLHRLSRTGSFVAATTYAGTEVAEAVIDRVRRVHDGVRGVAADGRPYAASDPELLRWVHVAEVVSFLHAHRRYHPAPPRGDDLDRYYAETAVVAERLGATEVPRSRHEVRAYFRSIRPELTGAGAGAELMGFLQRPITRDPATAAVHLLLIQAAVDLLPGWARQLHGLRRLPGADLLVVRPAAWTAMAALRAAAGPSPILRQAALRAGATAG